jgi:monoamine oxidase
VADRIGIIGGGFSGLLCAYLLEQLYGDRVEAVIFEGSDRLGGRVRTTPLPGIDAAYEAGVAEFYDIVGNSHLRRLVRHLGLETRPLTGTPYFVVGDRVVRDEGDLEAVLGRRGMDRLRRFWGEGTRLRPPGEYALAGQPRDNGHPWLRRTFEEVLSDLDDPYTQWFTGMQCHSDLATEPPHTSGLFGFDNLLVDHPGYCSMYTLSTGNEGLVRALAERVRSTVHRAAPVVSVEASDGAGVQVTVGGDGPGAGRVEVDALVATLTPPGLRQIRWDDAMLDDAVARHLRHHDHATVYLRVTLVFRRRFWRDRFPEDYFVSDAFDGVTVYDQSPDVGNAGVGIQSWLLGGAAALAMARRSDDEILAAVRGAMPAALPEADGLLLEGHVDRWVGPTGVSGLPGGVPLQSLDERHCPDARWPQVIFVGDYLYDSTLCGALDAVLWAVSRIGRKVSPDPSLPDPLTVFSQAGPDDSPTAPASDFFLDELVVRR